MKLVIANPANFISVFILLLFLTSCSTLGYGAKRIYKRDAVYYNVQKGDTIATIAKKHKVSPDQISLLNGITDPKSIKPGQRLLVQQAYEYEVSKEESSAPSSKKKSKKTIFYTDGKLKWPVQGGGSLVSKFGPRNGGFHDGIDIVASSGTPVLAAHDGEVIYAGDELSGYGNLLILRGKGEMKTVYAHNRRLLVEKGDKVKKGNKIAEVGSTGHAEGPHLHFEVRTRDSQGRFVAIDPLAMFKKNYGKPRYRVNDNLTSIILVSDKTDN